MDQSGRKEKHPSLPPDYVSLAQLQERWLQNQREKEMSEKREKELREKLEEDSKKQQRDAGSSENQKQRGLLKNDWREKKASIQDKGKGKEIVIDGFENKNDYNKNKKKKRKKRENRKKQSENGIGIAEDKLESETNKKFNGGIMGVLSGENSGNDGLKEEIAKRIDSRGWFSRNGYNWGSGDNSKREDNNRARFNRLKETEVNLASEKKMEDKKGHNRTWIERRRCNNRGGEGHYRLRENGHDVSKAAVMKPKLETKADGENLEVYSEIGGLNGGDRNGLSRDEHSRVVGEGLNDNGSTPDKKADEMVLALESLGIGEKGVVGNWYRGYGNNARWVGGWKANVADRRRYMRPGRFEGRWKMKEREKSGMMWVKKEDKLGAYDDARFGSSEIKKNDVIDSGRQSWWQRKAAVVGGVAMKTISAYSHSHIPFLSSFQAYNTASTAHHLGVTDAICLGFQHYILALGSIVLIPSMLVPQMGGTDRFVETMREIQGALIVSSFFQMAIGFTGLWRNIARLFTPLSIVPLVTLTGLGLHHLGFPLIATCLEVGIPELVLIIIIPQFVPRLIESTRPLCNRYALLLSVPIVWVYAEILTLSGAFNESRNVSCRTDGSGLISGAPWLYIPYPFQWGPPTFRVQEIFATIVASFVASTESTGSFIAAARYGSATPVPPSVISRGVGWLGTGTLLNALFGSVTGATATVENAGLLALTKAGSRRVVQISSTFMIFFSIFGKFGAIFASIPLPIMAASYCIFFGYVSSAGLGYLQFCNLNSFRTKLVLGFSFFIGLSLPQYLREHHVNSKSGWFNDILYVIFMSHATVAAIVALVLDRTVDYGSDEARKNNGSYWWDKFMVYNKDDRSDEFYKLPGQLNRCFPSL
ncbi:putative nucleobase-ascorbate transporter 10 [Phtheirospermum japonicum]|uniref:Putative nucleobase-ascorbate transporter 10 n=1 Tax=Phtheirospermum japonicum TaxID=374723 RepID=A0A830BAQ8_9LAMI|nr:putative nucleobase-ascorbate transporter 10 [Phtheirospermum japonicum]